MEQCEQHFQQYESDGIFLWRGIADMEQQQYARFSVHSSAQSSLHSEMIMKYVIFSIIKCLFAICT